MAPLQAAARRLLGAGPKLVYHPREAAPATGPMDPHRAASVLGWLVERRIARPDDVSAPAAAPLTDLLQVHGRDYLERVDERSFLERVFPGLPSGLDPWELIRWQRRMVGGTCLATRQALAGKPGHPVVHLGGGLHHARADSGGGFCLFNDVAVAVAGLRATGWTGRVLVVDVDVHQGDGTRAIFAADESVFTFSVHAEHWDTEPAVADRSIALGTSIEDAQYLQVLRDHLPEVVSDFRPALVFVVGGTDVAFDDPIGSWRITADAIFERDRFVLDLFPATPLVWTMAGGYGPEAWRYTARTLGWLYARRSKPIDSSAERALTAFRQIRRSLSASDLMADEAEDGEITLRDILGDLAPGHHRHWLLDIYSPYGVELALDRYGVLAKLRERGYDGVRVAFDLDHDTGQRLRLLTADGEEVLVDLVLRVHTSHQPWRLLWIEWLLMQDPRRAHARPLLPGQHAPGLGCSKEILGMLMMAAERLGLDGVGFKPTSFHVAWMARSVADFLEPSGRREFNDRREAFGRRPLHEVAERLRDWSPGPMAIPMSAAMKETFGP